MKSKISNIIGFIICISISEWQNKLPRSPDQLPNYYNRSLHPPHTLLYQQLLPSHSEKKICRYSLKPALLK